MKIFLMLLLCQTVSLKNTFALTIISDIDDTLKIADVLHSAHATQLELFSKEAFSGMPELFEMFAQHAQGFHYLSAQNAQPGDSLSGI